MSLRQLIEHINITLLDFSNNNIFEKGNLIKLRCFVSYSLCLRNFKSCHILIIMV